MHAVKNGLLSILRWFLHIFTMFPIQHQSYYGKPKCGPSGCFQAFQLALVTCMVGNQKCPHAPSGTVFSRPPLVQFLVYAEMWVSLALPPTTVLFPPLARTQTRKSVPFACNLPRQLLTQQLGVEWRCRVASFQKVEVIRLHQTWLHTGWLTRPHRPLCSRGLSFGFHASCSLSWNP